MLINKCAIFVLLATYALPCVAQTAPMLPPTHQSYGMQMLNGSSAGVLEAMTQLHIMQMFQQHSVQPEEIASIQFYKPFLASLQQYSPGTRDRIFQDALARGFNGQKLLLTAFCQNAYAAALENNILTPVEQNRLRSDMATSLLNQANGITNTSFGVFMKNALFMGLALGTVECMKRLIGDSLSRMVHKIPVLLSFASHLAGKGYNALCNRPDPLQPEELQVWRATFEGIMNALCEQNSSGALMLKNIRVTDEAQPASTDPHWSYLVNMVKQVCEHIHGCFDQSLAYYIGASGQRTYLVALARSVSMENRTSIAFLMKLIMNNMDNIVASCQKADNVDDLDIVHVKKMGRITLLLFDKLHLMIIGAYQSGGGQNAAYGVSSITEH